MNRLGLKISCLLVSILIWIQVASTASIEQTITLDLKVSGLAEGLTIAGSENFPKQVQARVTDSKLSIMAHQYFGIDVGYVSINLAGFSDTTFSYQLTGADVVPPTLDADVVRSRFLTITIDREISRPVPVVLDLEGSLPEGTGFVTAPRATPDSVVVTGPSRLFKPDLVLYSQEFDLDRLTESGEHTVKLNPVGDFLKQDRNKVVATFLVGRLEERTLANIPVIALVDAGHPEVGISPPVADVMVRGVADSIRVLTRDRVSVVVPVANLEVGATVLPGQVVYPDWLTLIRLDPPMFQVIVGDGAGGTVPPRDAEGRDE